MESQVLNHILSSFEEPRAFRRKPKRVTNIPCCHCGQSVIENEFPACFVQLCDNPQCPLFRERQGTRAKPMVTAARRKWLRKRSPQRQERYDLARSLGIGSIKALRLRDQTTIDIREFAKEHIKN